MVPERQELYDGIGEHAPALPSQERFARRMCNMGIETVEGGKAMTLMQRRLVPVIALALVSASLLGPIGSLNAIAAEFDVEQLEIIDELARMMEAEAVNALEASIILLTLAQMELREEVLAEATPAEWSVIAAYVVNLLVGPEDEHFDEEYALASIKYGEGAIAYVEAIAGAKKEDFADVDLAALVEEGNEAAETEALLRLLLARNLLLQEAVDGEVLAAAERQITEALKLLKDLLAEQTDA